MEIADIVAQLRRRFDATGEDDRLQVEPEDIAGWAAATGLGRSSLFDAIGLHLARGFHHDELEFWFCDTVVNALNGYVVWDEAMRADWPRMFWAAFEAFDAGEFSRDPAIDPIQSYTRPLIAKLLGTIN